MIALSDTGIIDPCMPENRFSHVVSKIMNSNS